MVIRPGAPDTELRLAWLTPHGEAAALIRSIDWSSSPIGDPSTWPQSLRSAINACLTSAIPMYVWWGAENVNIYNDAYIPIVGARRHPQYFGRPAREMWPEIWPTMQGYLDHIHTTGRAVQNEDLLFQLERNGFREDCYFSFSFNPCLDESGAVRGAIAIVQETTTKFHALKARARAEAEAEVARQDLYDFFMQAPAPMVILLGPEHRFALANPPYERLVGRKVVGKTVLEAFTPEEVGHFVRLLDDVYRTGVSHIGEEMPLTIADERGETREMFVSVAYHPFMDRDGSIKGVLAFHQIVTEQVLARKRAEKLASDLQASVHVRDEFLSIASHELKTPITSLKLQLQMLKRRIRPEQGQVTGLERVGAAVDISLRQTDRLTELIEDLLDVSRIQAGKLSFEFEEIELAPLVQEVVDRFADSSEAARAPLRIEVTPGLRGQWDRSRLEQVIVNLVSNAIKYAPGHPIYVRAYAAGDRAVISVQDSGPGIARELQSSVFERFVRAAASRDLSGLGLGLYIVRQIVEGHGGSIRVESTPGVGTTFVVELPMLQSLGTGRRSVAVS